MLSFRNLLNVDEIINPLGSESAKRTPTTNVVKYIKGYANTTNDPTANNIFKKLFGSEHRQQDEYDPYNTTNSKKEDFWQEKDGKTVQLEVDEKTNTFKRGLYTNNELGGYGQNDYWYEDPYIPSFELSFDTNTSFFNDQILRKNSFIYFIEKYKEIDDSYNSRLNMWEEFKKVFFKIFDSDTLTTKKRKAYYVTKLAGLEVLNKKITNFGEDKITITLNEDVSMIAWYISELYNNMIYSFKNKRYMFPDNVLRFDMTIKINDIREFQVPSSDNANSSTNSTNKDYIANKNIKYTKALKSQIIYTLHDCNFNFFESKNYTNELEIGGFGNSGNFNPQTLEFDIFFKSVSRSSTYPLIKNSLNIDGWENSITTEIGSIQDHTNNINRINSEDKTEKDDNGNIKVKGFLNPLLTKAKQTVTNRGISYLDSLETKLREVRGEAVNGLLSQFNKVTGVNKIEPDNVYSKNFNNRLSVSNLGKQIASDLITDLQDSIRNTANF